MGEKDGIQSEGEKKPAVDGGGKAAADGGEKKEVEEPLPVVLKLDLHCEGCANKVRRSVRHLPGVEKVKADWEARKLTVTGNVDPTWLRQTVEKRTRKKVELISPPPKKDGGGTAGGEKNAGQKPEKDGGADDSHKKSKEVAINTVVMKIKLHCDGCAHKIKRIILKNIDGVASASTDIHKDSITVIGTVDPNELSAYLRKKLRREVEIIPPKKTGGGGGDGGGGGGGDGGGVGCKKEEHDSRKIEKGGGDGGERKEKAANEGGDEAEMGKAGGNEAVAKEAGGDGARKVGTNKMEQYYNYNPRTYYYAAGPGYDRTYSSHEFGSSYIYGEGRVYLDSDFIGQYGRGPPPPPPPTYLNPNEGVLSDENPNGCYVM